MTDEHAHRGHGILPPLPGAPAVPDMPEAPPSFIGGWPSMEGPSRPSRPPKADADDDLKKGHTAMATLGLPPLELAGAGMRHVDSNVGLELHAMAAAPAGGARSAPSGWTAGADASGVSAADCESNGEVYHPPDPRSPAFALFGAEPALVDGTTLPRLPDRVDPPERPLWPLLAKPTGANLRALASLIITPPARFLDPWMGVMVPCVQNILGTLYFIRVSWIIGQAGLGHMLAIFFMSVILTGVSALSLCAIATNGEIKGGGPNWLISRTLGPELGMAAGLCYYIGTCIATALYTLGATEILFHTNPGLRFFTPATATTTALADSQIWGVMMLIALMIIVLGGVKVIARFYTSFLMVVLLAIFFIVLGTWVGPRFDPDSVAPTIPPANFTGTYITGLKASTFAANWAPLYVETNAAGTPTVGGGYNWTFASMLGLFFPTVCGIFAGSNRAAFLKDPARAIPKGTIAAHLLTTGIYLVSIIFFAGACGRDYLLQNKYFTATVAFPSQELAIAGIFISCFSAAMQTLISAPRLLQALAVEKVLTVLNPVITKEGLEPRKAMIPSFIIALGMTLAGSVDTITPIMAQFYLLCYGTTNLAALLGSLFDTPNWRPRFKFYHPITAAIGLGLCLSYQWVISPMFAGIALGFYILVAVATARSGNRLNWGDAMKSVRVWAAIQLVLSLQKLRPLHPKNFVPQVLLLCKPWNIAAPAGREADDSASAAVHVDPRMLGLAQCLTDSFHLPTGMGYVLCATVVDGDPDDLIAEADKASAVLTERVARLALRGAYRMMCQAVAAPDTAHGLAGLMRAAGLGVLCPNILLLAWPLLWRDDPSAPRQLCHLIRGCHAAGKAAVVAARPEQLPGAGDGNKSAWLDVYWTVADGGFLLLLSKMLRKGGMYRSCRTRVFLFAETPAQEEAQRAAVARFCYELRLECQVVAVLLSRPNEHGPVSHVNLEGISEDSELESGRIAAGDTPGPQETNRRDRDDSSSVRNAGSLRPSGLQRTGSIRASILRPGDIEAIPGTETPTAPGAAAAAIGDDFLPPGSSVSLSLAADSAELPAADAADSGRVLANAAAMNRAMRRLSEHSSLVLASLPLPLAAVAPAVGVGPGPGAGAGNGGVNSGANGGQRVHRSGEEGGAAAESKPGMTAASTERLYMKSLERLMEDVPRLLLVRGFTQSIVTIYC